MRNYFHVPRRDGAAATTLGLALFIVYALGACPTIYVGDSGELVAAVYLLGIPHPSGYPLYIILGKLWTLLLPIGSIAYRMSLFSAACAAATGGLLYRLGRRLDLHPVAALLAALLLAFSTSFWGEANVQRVYALNAVFVVLATTAVYDWHQTGDRRALAFAFFLCGLGATNHTFMAICAIALGGFVTARSFTIPLPFESAQKMRRAMRPAGQARRPVPTRPDFSWRRVKRSFMIAVDKLQQTLRDGPTKMGPLQGEPKCDSESNNETERPEEPPSFGRRLEGLLARKSIVSFGEGMDFLRPIGIAATAFAMGLLPYLYLPLRARVHPALDWGKPETLQGFVNVVLRRDFWERAYIESPADLVPIAVDYLRSLGTELTWLGAAAALLGVAVARRQRFVMLPLLVMAGNLAALALHGSRSDIFIWHRYYIPSYVMAALLAGIGCDALLRRMPRPLRWLPLALPAVLAISGWSHFDRSRYRVAEDFSHAVLRALPPGAHIIATDDNILFVLIYLHLVERERPDVDLILQGVSQADLPPLRFDPDTEPLFFTHHPNWNLPSLEIVPVGVVLQAWRAGQAPPPVLLPPERLPGEDDPAVPKDYLTQNLIGHFHYTLGFTFEQRDWPRAQREFEAAAAASPDNDVLFYNLGLLYRRNGLLDEALRAFQRSAAINPRRLASAKPTRATDRIAEVTAEQQRVAAIESGLTADPVVQSTSPNSPAYHRRLAELLDARGEATAARGHQLRALQPLTAE